MTVGRSTIVFLHIPKNGGETMKDIIAGQYHSRHRLQLPGDPQTFETDLNYLEAIPPERRHALKAAITGSIFSSKTESLLGPCTYFTLLRKPVERVISRYYYLSGIPESEDPTYQDFASYRMTLSQFVQSDKATMYVNNAQTRFIAGVGEDVGFGNCSPDTLEQAKKNLREHFSVVGLLERYDVSVVLMKRIFGWRMPLYRIRNVTERRPPITEVPRQIVDIIEQNNRLDLELYHHCAAVLREMVEMQGEDFENDVVIHKRLNSAFQRVPSQLSFENIERKIKSPLRPLRRTARIMIDRARSSR